MKTDEIQVRGKIGTSSVIRNGKTVEIPEGWIFVPSGDPLLTRRLKNTGSYWLHVHERKGRIEAIGVWVPSEICDAVKSEIAEIRNDPAYARRQAASRKAREKKQTDFCAEFRAAILRFLKFHPDYSRIAEKIADAIVKQSAGVGSGTVARTGRLSIEKKAESAVIAWMRHQTTAYDRMKIARVKGRRFEVRRELAKGSRLLLDSFRNGNPDRESEELLIRAVSGTCG